MSALRERKAVRVDDLVPEEDELGLALVLDPAYRRVLIELHFLVGDTLPVDPLTFRLRDEDTEALLEEAARRVVMISSTTREAIAEVLQEGQREGWPTQQVADAIAGLFDVTWKHRPETVARTEIGHAQLLSAENRYRASGLVDNVRIRDGDGDEPCASQNGTVVPLGEHGGLNHPNCTKLIIPILRDGII
jgi:hypothetical protein